VQIGQMEINELFECLTVALGCSRYEIQRFPPSCSMVQTSWAVGSFGRSCPRGSSGPTMRQRTRGMFFIDRHGTGWSA
jgi:hypothetical protein